VLWYVCCCEVKEVGFEFDLNVLVCLVEMLVLVLVLVLVPVYPGLQVGTPGGSFIDESGARENLLLALRGFWIFHGHQEGNAHEP